MAHKQGGRVKTCAAGNKNNSRIDRRAPALPRFYLSVRTGRAAKPGHLQATGSLSAIWPQGWPACRSELSREGCSSGLRSLPNPAPHHPTTQLSRSLDFSPTLLAPEFSGLLTALVPGPDGPRLSVARARTGTSCAGRVRVTCS